jgi:hypothetical protein
VIVLEVYCDGPGCDAVAPIHDTLKGMGVGQAAREAVPKYLRDLAGHGWSRLWLTGDDLCPDCTAMAKEYPEKFDHEPVYARVRHPKARTKSRYEHVKDTGSMHPRDWAAEPPTIEVDW